MPNDTSRATRMEINDPDVLEAITNVERQKILIAKQVRGR
jgi:hypothetical protein